MANQASSKSAEPNPVPLTEQPELKMVAAQQVGMTLATTDQWSQPYWNKNDLHWMERELFG